MRVAGVLLLLGVGIASGQYYSGYYGRNPGRRIGDISRSLELKPQKYRSLFPVVVVGERQRRHDYGYGGPSLSLDPIPGYGVPGYTSGSPVGYSGYSGRQQNTRYEVLEAKNPPKEENLSRYVVLKEYNVPPRVLSSVASYGPPSTNSVSSVTYRNPLAAEVSESPADAPAPGDSPSAAEMSSADSGASGDSGASTDSGNSGDSSASGDSAAAGTGDSGSQPSLTDIQKSLNLIVKYLESQYLDGLEKGASAAPSSMGQLMMTLDAPAMSATDSYAASAGMSAMGGSYQASGQPEAPPKPAYGAPAEAMPPGLLDLFTDIKKALLTTAVKAGKAGLGIAGSKTKLARKTVGNTVEHVVESVGHVRSIFA